MVSLPLHREVTDYQDFPGRTEAVKWIDLRSRVTGYLKEVCFSDGANVRKGEVLFEIDPRPYDAELAQAEANLTQARAHETRLKADLDRGAVLLARRALSREDYDKFVGDYQEAVAAVAVAAANRDKAKLNVEFTKITAPIDGHISRRNIDPGNLVKADDTILTNIVSIGKIYASFDVDEGATSRLKELERAGKLSFYPGAKMPVLLGKASEQGFPRKGDIEFADNHIDADTGTWRLRGTFENKDNALTSGLFVHIRLPLGDPYPAILVAEEALAADQGERFVYVVDEEGKARYKRVTVGRLHDGLRVITGGIGPTDKVIVKGLQRARPNEPVNAKLIPMPEQKPVAAPAEGTVAKQP
jgi:RND family efflux transporter MFP subunit